MNPRMLWGGQKEEMYVWNKKPQKYGADRGNKLGALAILVVLAVVVAFLLLIPQPARAQNQQAATEIAKNGNPTLTVPNFMQCFELLSKKMKPEKASSECLKAIKVGGQISTKNNNEAADATKNNFPKVIVPIYGGGYYGSYNSGLAGAYMPGFIPGGGPGGLNIVYSSTTGGNGGYNRRY